MRVGYVVKRYPRYSETFVVNEILAHEMAGLEIEIFSLRPPVDGHFQDAIARVRATVNYLPYTSSVAFDFWEKIKETSMVFPDLWKTLPVAYNEDFISVYQAAVLARAAHQKNIHHLHAHFASSATTVTRLASYFSGIPYTFTAHAKDIFHESINPDDMQRKLNDAAAAITVSNYNYRYLNQNYNHPTERLTCIYNGLDLGIFRFQSPQKRQTRVVAVGRLVEKKGLAYLIEACAILSARNQHVHCQIVGAGPLEASLRAMIERLELHNRVELLGPRPQQEITHLVQNAAVFAAPCIVGSDGDRDGLPTVLLEAMALGTPCVSTNVSGIPEIVRDNETGLLVPQKSPAELAIAIEHLLTDPELRVRLASRARQMIDAEFDIHRNSARMRELFNGVHGIEKNTSREER